MSCDRSLSFSLSLSLSLSLSSLSLSLSLPHSLSFFFSLSLLFFARAYFTFCKVRALFLSFSIEHGEQKKLVKVIRIVKAMLPSSACVAAVRTLVRGSSSRRLCGAVSSASHGSVKSSFSCGGMHFSSSLSSREETTPFWLRKLKKVEYPEGMQQPNSFETPPSEAMGKFLEDEFEGDDDDFKAGRPWLQSELRLKSFEDLHKLWYVCLIEKNKLLSTKHRMRSRGMAMKGPERIKKVRTTMRRIKTVVRERALMQMIRDEQLEHHHAFAELVQEDQHEEEKE